MEDTLHYEGGIEDFTNISRKITNGKKCPADWKIYIIFPIYRGNVKEEKLVVTERFCFYHFPAFWLVDWETG
jgi:hypothetical protein